MEYFSEELREGRLLTLFDPPDLTELGKLCGILSENDLFSENGLLSEWDLLSVLRGDSDLSDLMDASGSDLVVCRVSNLRDSQRDLPEPLDDCDFSDTSLESGKDMLLVCDMIDELRDPDLFPSPDLSSSASSLEKVSKA